MSDFRKIVKVEADRDFSIICRMENGETYRFDMSFLMTKDWLMIVPLKERYFFELVGLDGRGNISWPNGFDIHADTIAREGVQIKKVA